MFTHTLSIRSVGAIGLVVLALFIGGFTSAQAQTSSASITELQTMIAQLMDRLAALSGGSSTGGGTATPSNTNAACTPFVRTLSLGSTDAATGGEVTKLQERLAASGHFTYGQPTGFFGPATAAAVQRWQAANGIVSAGTPDTTGFGMFGPSSRAKLNAQCGVTRTSPVINPVVAPTLEITSPRAGADFEAGERVTVRWNTKGLAGYTGAIILTGNNVERYLARNVNLGAGELRVRIPESDTLGAVTTGSYALMIAVLNVKDGAADDVRGRVVIDITGEEDEEVPAGGCINGGVTYPEGTKRNSLDGVPFIADIGYVCEDGEWKSENGLARPVEPTPSASCLIGRVSYPEGTTRTGVMQPDGTWLLIADISSVCENGKWVSKNTYPLPPTPTPSTSCAIGGTSYPEGTTRTGVMQPDGTWLLIADISSVCENGKWVSKNTYPLPPPPVYPLPTCTLSASRTSVLAGTTSRLTWTSTNTGTTRATLTGFAPDTINPRNTTGYRDVKPTTSTTYTLTVKNDAGQTATCSVRVSVSMSGVRGAATSSLEHELTKLVASLEAFVATLR